MIARTRGRTTGADAGTSLATSDASPAASDEVDSSLLESVVGYNLRRAAARQRERFRSVFDTFEIRPVQLTALTLILHNEPLRQTLLGKALEMKRANVVTILDELQGRGLIKRELAPDDRRSYELHLTNKGRKLTEEMLSLHAKLESDLARSLGSDELKQLVKLLTKFRRLAPAPKLR